MRCPTPEHVRLAYWRRAMGLPVIDAGAAAHLVRRHDEDPECGFYKIRFKGPWQPVEIVMEQEILPDSGELLGDERIFAVIAGRPISEELTERWWGSWRFKPITEAAYWQMMADRDGAQGGMWKGSAAKVDLAATPIAP